LVPLPLPLLLPLPLPPPLEPEPEPDPDPLEEPAPVVVLPDVAVAEEPDPAVLARVVATITPAPEQVETKAWMAFGAWLPQALTMPVSTCAALLEQMPFRSAGFGCELSALRRHAGGLPANALAEPAATMREARTVLVCITNVIRARTQLEARKQRRRWL